VAGVGDARTTKMRSDKDARRSHGTPTFRICISTPSSEDARFQVNGPHCGKRGQADE
jgi:phage terminase large subunit GpA-like protein